VDADGNPLLIGPFWKKELFFGLEGSACSRLTQPVSGIKMSRTPPSAVEAGCFFIAYCTGLYIFLYWIDSAHVILKTGFCNTHVLPP